MTIALLFERNFRTFVLERYGCSLFACVGSNVDFRCLHCTMLLTHGVFSLNLTRSSCIIIAFATCVVPFQDTVSSLKSLLSQTIVVNDSGFTFLGMMISWPLVVARAYALSCQ
jgi:hypothetical protein